jgi:hypothetical protein
MVGRLGLEPWTKRLRVWALAGINTIFYPYQYVAMHITWPDKILFFEVLQSLASAVKFGDQASPVIFQL